MLLMSEFIVTVKDFLSEELCKDLVDLFENNKDNHERYEDKPRFTQLVIPQGDLHKQVIDQTIQAVELYAEKVSLFRDVLNNCSGVENPRIKKYDAEQGDWFEKHVDVNSHSSAIRALGIFWYLNEPDGGSTRFKHNRFDEVIQATTGKCVMFPPMWMFPHEGTKLFKGTKYLLSTYMHYKNE